MYVTGNLINDGSVSFINIESNGLEIYATFIDNAGNLKVTRLNYNTSISATPIATGANSIA